ncbi:MAG: macro domain-containing protein [Parachlamydia sp.]|nr:macro domain-containing protein [Parachlamydia sp.]
MQVNLTTSNFFKYYMFNPNAPELSSRDRRIAKVATVALFIFTAGIVPLISYAFIYDRNFNKKNAQGNNPGINPGNNPVKGPAVNAPVQVLLLSPKCTQVRIGNCVIKVRETQDICKLPYDAIVNAANAQLQAGDGVCGAIHQQGGQAIFDECANYLRQRHLNALEEGDAIMTTGGALQARYVIHAVGPRWKGNQETEDKQRLYNAYYKSLQVAAANNLSSIAFPAISTGIFGFPVSSATQVAIQAAADFAVRNPNSSVKTITMAITPNKFQDYNKALLALVKNQSAAPKAGSKPNDLLLSFYKGEGRDVEGRLLWEMWQLSDAEKSQGHDFIQWLFPTFQESQFNKNSPVLNQQLANALKADPVIVDNMRRSFESMLSYYGMRYDVTSDKVVAAPNLEERKRDWFHADDHNFRRISRILSCLKTMGLNKEGKAFFDFLAQMNQAQPGVFQNSFNIWRQIVS